MDATFNQLFYIQGLVFEKLCIGSLLLLDEFSELLCSYHLFVWLTAMHRKLSGSLI